MVPAAADVQAIQLALFEQEGRPRPSPTLTTPDALTADSTLDQARWWYRLELETRGHPPNTVSAYTNDLAVLHAQVGTKPLRSITAKDIGAYLEGAKQRSTRKRRLTSVREFFSFVVKTKHVLARDPTEAFYPERINLKTPVPLFTTERAELLAAAEADGPRSFVLVYLLLELGFNRTEVLNLRRQHIDLSVPDAPVIYISYDDPRWRHKERRLLADARLSAALEKLELGDDERIFAVLPQAINAMLHRLVRAAGLKRSVTPQSLRDTFGVEQARMGKDEDALLGVLGLATDPRNRDSVRRYIRLANPPQEVLSGSN